MQAKGMKPLSKKKDGRVIFHLDLDCFYCAVEHRRLGIPTETPLAVQQWNGLIAVNYAARALGVSRHMRADEAKEKFPQLELVHVEVLQQQQQQQQKPPHSTQGEVKTESVGKVETQRDETKVSLRRYREASFEVMTVIRRFAPAKWVERASIDEVYVDATELINKQETNTLAATWETSATNVLGILKEEDEDLQRGAVLMAEIRDAILRETQFTMSGGIACNKLLAKIASAQNKPNKQTLVPRYHGIALVRSLPFTKVPGLGGKFGKSLRQLLEQRVDDQSTVEKATLEDVVTLVPYELLVTKFGTEGADSIVKLSFGESDKQVVPKMAPKSLLSAKSFRGTDNQAQHLSWVRLLASELFDRVRTDAFMFGRIPTKMTLSWASKGPGNTKRIKVPKPSPLLAYVQAMDAKEAAKAEEILQRGVEQIVEACTHELTKEWMVRISLQLDSFESIQLHGSWSSDEPETSQQNKFRAFFSKSTDVCESAPCAKGTKRDRIDARDADERNKERGSDSSIAFWTDLQQTNNKVPAEKLSKKQMQSTNEFEAQMQSTNEFEAQMQSTNEFEAQMQTKQESEMQMQSTNEFEAQMQTKQESETQMQTKQESEAQMQTKQQSETQMQTKQKSEMLMQTNKESEKKVTLTEMQNRELEKKVANNAFNRMLLSSLEKGFSKQPSRKRSKKSVR